MHTREENATDTSQNLIPEMPFQKKFWARIKLPFEPRPAAPDLAP